MSSLEDAEKAHEFSLDWLERRENPATREALLPFRWALHEAYLAGLAAGRAENEGAMDFNTFSASVDRARYWERVEHVAAGLLVAWRVSGPGSEHQAILAGRALVDAVNEAEVGEEGGVITVEESP